MAISRAKKTEKVQLLAKELEGSTTAIIGTFSKLTVAKDFQLRKVIREAGGKYRVVKNKLAAVSGQGTKVEAALQGLKGGAMRCGQLLREWQPDLHSCTGRIDGPASYR